MVRRKSRKEEDKDIREEVRRKEKSEENEKREGEKEENETVNVKRRCVNLVSTEAFGIFSQGEELESCGLSWGDLLEDPGDLLDRDSGSRMKDLWCLLCLFPLLRW